MVVAFVVVAAAFSERLEAAFFAHVSHDLYLGLLSVGDGLRQARDGLVVGALDDGLGHGDRRLVVWDHQAQEYLFRFLVFGADGEVYESAEPVWDENRVARER